MAPAVHQPTFEQFSDLLFQDQNFGLMIGQTPWAGEGELSSGSSCNRAISGTSWCDKLDIPEALCA